MAYDNSRNPQGQQQGYRKPNTPSTQKPAASSSNHEGSKSDSINVAGLYEGRAGTKLAMKSGTLKEAVTIPAGYVLKVFTKGGVSKNGKELPPFEIVAQPALKKS